MAISDFFFLPAPTYDLAAWRLVKNIPDMYMPPGSRFKPCPTGDDMPPPVTGIWGLMGLGWMCLRGLCLCCWLNLKLLSLFTTSGWGFLALGVTAEPAVAAAEAVRGTLELFSCCSSISKPLLLAAPPEPPTCFSASPEPLPTNNPNFFRIL